MYALATGRPPFRGESPLAVLRKISDSRPRPILQINEQMPAWLDSLVGGLMEIDCSRRTPTAAAAADQMRDVLSHIRSPADHPLPRSLTSTRPRTAGLFAAGAIASIMIAAGFFLAERLGPTDTDPNRSAARSAAASTPATATADFSELDWPDGSLTLELMAINQQIDSLTQSIEYPDLQSASASRLNSSTQPEVQKQDQP
jgi:serine/threonine-protein kinase